MLHFYVVFYYYFVLLPEKYERTKQTWLWFLFFLRRQLFLLNWNLFILIVYTYRRIMSSIAEISTKLDKINIHIIEGKKSIMYLSLQNGKNSWMFCLIFHHHFCSFWRIFLIDKLIFKKISNILNKILFVFFKMAFYNGFNIINSHEIAQINSGL